MFDAERVKRPELVLGELLRSYAEGELTRSGKVLYRAVVLAVDEEGGRLSSPHVSTAAEEVQGVGVDGHPRSYAPVVGAVNPRGSVKALVIDGARDSFYDEASARVLWPLFPSDQLSLPICAGEHVYSLFEDGAGEHGLWLCRVSGHDGANFSLGSEALAGMGEDRRSLGGLFGHPGEAPASTTDDGSSTRVRPDGRRLSRLF